MSEAGPARPLRRAIALAAAALALACADPGLERAISQAEASAAAARAGDVDALYDFMRRTHPALFHHNSREKIEAEVARLRASAPRLSWPEFVVGVQRVLKLVGDAQTSLSPLPETGPGFDTRLPLLVETFGDGTYVIGADARYRDAVGARLVAVSGRPLEEVRARLAAFWPHENRTWVLRWTPLLLRRPGYLVGSGIAEGDDVAAPAVFRVRLASGALRDFAVIPVPATADEQAQRASWVYARDEAGLARPTRLHGGDAAFDFVELPEQRTVYAVYRQCEDGERESVAAFAERLFAFVESHDALKLAIDLRENGGGGDEKKNEALLSALERSKLNRPGGLFVLIGRRTFAAAQSFATQAERRTQALFAGEPSGSAPNHYGEPRPFRLPSSGLSVTVATKLQQDSDAADARFNLPPDTPAWGTFDDWQRGRDAALEAVLRYRPTANSRPFDPRERWRDGRGRRKSDGR